MLWTDLAASALRGGRGLQLFGFGHGRLIILLAIVVVVLIIALITTRRGR